MVKTNLQLTKTSQDPIFLNPTLIQKGNSSTPEIEEEQIHSTMPLQMRTVEGEFIKFSGPSAPISEDPSSKELTLSTIPGVPRRRRKIIGEEDEPEERTEEGPEPAETHAEVEATTSTLSDYKRYILGFSVDLAWCESQNYFELLDVLKFQEWVHLFSECYNNPLAPEAMNEFCANFRMHSGTCFSSVKGTNLSFDAQYLSELLLVPNTGYDTYFKGKFNLKIGNVSKEELILSLGGTLGKNKIGHKSLQPFHRLLLNFVWRAIVPRTQKRNEANLLDCAVIYCLSNKLPINFPSLMLQHLEHTVPSGYKVGYGALLTSLFLNSGVPMDGYGLQKQKDEQILKASTLKNLSLAVEGGRTVNLSNIPEKAISSKKPVPKPSKRKRPTIKIEVPGSRKSARLFFKEHQSSKSSETIILDDEGNICETIDAQLVEGTIDPEGEPLRVRQETSDNIVLQLPTSKDMGTQPSVGDLLESRAPDFVEENLVQETQVTADNIIHEGTQGDHISFQPVVPSSPPTAPPLASPSHQASTEIPSSFPGLGFSAFSISSLEQLYKSLHDKMDLIITTQGQQQQKLEDLHMEFCSLKTLVTSTHKELTQKMDEMVFEPLPDIQDPSN